MSLTNSSLNYPYGIFNITENLEEGDAVTFFTDINNTMSYTPFRIILFVSFLVLYQLGVWFRPNMNRFKILSFAGILTAISIGVLSFYNFVPATDSVLYILISAGSWFFGSKNE